MVNQLHLKHGEFCAYNPVLLSPLPLLPFPRRLPNTLATSLFSYSYQ